MCGGRFGRTLGFDTLWLVDVNRVSGSTRAIRITCVVTDFTQPPTVEFFRETRSLSRTLISRSDVPSPLWASRIRPKLFQERSIINDSKESRNAPWMDRKQKADAMFFARTQKTECCAAG